MIHRLARLIWWWILVSMRKPAAKRFQRKMIMILPKSMQARAWKSVHRQNLWALRWGERMLRWTLLVVTTSIMFSVAFQLVVTWIELGVFTVPEYSSR